MSSQVESITAAAAGTLQLGGKATVNRLAVVSLAGRILPPLRGDRVRPAKKRRELVITPDYVSLRIDERHARDHSRR